ncbi:MAG: heme o synthase [Saprospiraceae bacterium]|nr:heme o synthase [Saprospiraceae bacterium]MDW8228784.1 heme o synthase [Saprospiraceae bacterium]
MVPSRKSAAADSSGVSATSYSRQWVRDWALLVKFRLSLMVLFSALISFGIVGGSQAAWSAWLLLAMGGFLVTGAANALNQVLEREYDVLMKRTANRPVAAGRMSVSQAVLLAGLMAVGGLSALAFFNPLTGFLGTLSLVTYAFLYTPLKRYSSLSVLVGAIPGALPVVIGAVAWEGSWSHTASMLFILQFLWQFPHFWAVAWVADEDYRRAGFYLLPTREGRKTPMVGLLSFGFCLLLFLNAVLGYGAGLISLWAMLALCLINGYFAGKCWALYRTCTEQAARRQMFVSFLHLPFSLLVVLADVMLSGGSL